MAQSDNDRRNRLNTLLIVLIGQVGCLTLVIITLSLLGGLWLDNHFGTRPWLTLALLLAGTPLSVLAMLYFSRRMVARIKMQSEPGTKDRSA
jgi:F0F1-type ATP synthase assembly protein I